MYPKKKMILAAESCMSANYYQYCTITCAYKLHVHFVTSVFKYLIFYQIYYLILVNDSQTSHQNSLNHCTCSAVSPLRSHYTGWFKINLTPFN